MKVIKNLKVQIAYTSKSSKMNLIEIEGESFQFEIGIKEPGLNVVKKTG